MPATAFSQVLDEMLGADVRASMGRMDPIGDSAPGYTFRPPHPLLFFRLPPADRPPVPVPLRVPPGGTAPASTGGARLSSEQRLALATLVALGVTLPPAFTDSDLRRQYRLLARRIHPDRHPTATPDQRQELSRAFAAAAQSYKLLIADC